jgi:hypothetical protein
LFIHILLVLNLTNQFQQPFSLPISCIAKDWVKWMIICQQTPMKFETHEYRFTVIYAQSDDHLTLSKCITGSVQMYVRHLSCVCQQCTNVCQTPVMCVPTVYKCISDTCHVCANSVQMYVRHLSCVWHSKVQISETL